MDTLEMLTPIFPCFKHSAGYCWFPQSRLFCGVSSWRSLALFVCELSRRVVSKLDLWKSVKTDALCNTLKSILMALSQFKTVPNGAP
jgi:hypothetical protein